MLRSPADDAKWSELLRCCPLGLRELVSTPVARQPFLQATQMLKTFLFPKQFLGSWQATNLSSGRQQCVEHSVSSALTACT